MLYYIFVMYIVERFNIMMFLNIVFWNVYGLNDYKLDDDYFSSLSSKYEVVCLVEIMLKDFLKYFLGYLFLFIVKFKKNKKGEDFYVECLFLLILFYRNFFKKFLKFIILI